MVQETGDLNLKKSQNVSADHEMAGLKTKRLIADLKGDEVHALGVEVSGAQATQWHRVWRFWNEYFKACWANLRTYSVLRNSPELRHSHQVPVGRRDGRDAHAAPPGGVAAVAAQLGQHQPDRVVSFDGAARDAKCQTLAGGSHITRWTAAALLEAEKKFRKLKGYRSLEELERILNPELHSQAQVA